MTDVNEIKAGWYEYNGEHFFVQRVFGNKLGYWMIHKGWEMLTPEMEEKMIWSDKQYGE